MGRCPCSGQSCHVPSPSRLLNFGRSSSADLPFRIASHRNSSLSRLIAAGLFSPSLTSLRRRLCVFPPIVFFNPHSVFLFSTSSTAFGRVAPPFYCCSQLAIVVVIVICSHSRYPDFRHLISSLSLALTQRQTHPLSLLVHILLYTYNLILHCIQPNTGTYRKEKKGRKPTQKKGYPIHQSTNPHSLQPFYIPQERQQPQQQHHHLKISAFVDFDRIPQTLYPRRFWNNSFSTPNLSHLQLL